MSITKTKNTIKCLKFSGTGQAINLGTSNPFTGSFYFSMWFNWSGANGAYQQIFNKRDSWGSSTVLFSMSLKVGTNQLIVDNVNANLNTGYVPTVGVLTHLIWVHDTSLNKEYFYINGFKVYETTKKNLGNGTDALITVGACQSPAIESFNGYIDKVVIGTTALTASEAYTAYATDVYPDSSIWTRLELNEGSGNTAIDSSGNGHNGTIVLPDYSILTGNKLTLSFDAKMGVACHLDGLSNSELKIQLASMANAGVQWIRYDFTMNKIEKTQGVYDFSIYDNITTQALTYGIQTIALMVQYSTPTWANGGHASTYPALPEHYQEWCRVTADHFKNIIPIYELGNEPNGTAFWPPAADAAAYTTLMKAGYTGIKAGDSNAFVLTAGLAGNYTIDADDFLTTMYANGAKGYFDGFAIHPYVWPRTLPVDFSMIDTCKAIMTTNGDGDLPIYITEVGTPTGTDPTHSVSETEQASRLTTLYTNIINGNYQYVPVLCWYDFKDDYTDLTNPENNYGLIHNQNYSTPYLPKPAYYSYKKVPLIKRPINWIPDSSNTASWIRTDTASTNWS